MVDNGGDIIAQIIKNHGVPFIFTLCGGHISPILAGCKKIGIGVIDVRDEANAVFAADAAARLSGIPGVAVVTAGPGVTNTVTAVKNAQMAQSPVIILGGSAATVIKGRGSLQDIDQASILRPIVKAVMRLKKVCDIVPVIERAFQAAQSGVPGPVFVECPIDLLYSEDVVRKMYRIKSDSSAGSGIRNYLINFYLKRHVDRMFACSFDDMEPVSYHISSPRLRKRKVAAAADRVRRSSRPVMILGSQSMLYPLDTHRLADAVTALGIPVYLTGMARGLLGRENALQHRHQRKEALKRADLVILGGMPADFRLEYGRGFARDAYIVSVNRSRRDLYLNIRPHCAVHSDPFMFICSLASELHGYRGEWGDWYELLQSNEQFRNSEIDRTSGKKTDFINPLRLLKAVGEVMDQRSIIVADGGDFVGTASYILRPPRPLSWLDPGVYGTLGVGAGFALGARLCRPDSEVWIIYGDGAAGYSLIEFDTFVRHGVPVIAIVGNDAGWTQIARDQVHYLGDDVATGLNRSDYHIAAEGLGGCGLLLKNERKIPSVLKKAKSVCAKGKPVLINALISTTEFRKGSISM